MLKPIGHDTLFRFDWMRQKGKALMCERARIRASKTKKEKKQTHNLALERYKEKRNNFKGRIKSKQLQESNKTWFVIFWPQIFISHTSDSIVDWISDINHLQNVPYNQYISYADLCLLKCSSEPLQAFSHSLALEWLEWNWNDFSDVFSPTDDYYENLMTQ